MSQTNKNERVRFSRGPSASMPTKLVAGTLLIDTDTGNVYLDDSAFRRIQLKDDTKLPLTGGVIDGDLTVRNIYAENLHNSQNMHTYTLNNPKLTSDSNECIWHIDANESESVVSISVKDKSTNSLVICEIIMSEDDKSFDIAFLGSTIPENTYQVKFITSVDSDDSTSV